MRVVINGKLGEPFDAAVLNPEWGLIAQTGGAGKVSAALEHTRRLLERYPDWKASEKYGQWIYQLEEYYRSR